MALRKKTSPPSKSKRSKATASGAAGSETAQQPRATDKVERKKAVAEVWMATLTGSMSYTSRTGKKYLKDRPVPITSEEELADLQTTGLFHVALVRS